MERLTEGLARLPLSAIYASPMKRTRETAEIIARTFRLSAVSNDRLAEIDYGSWTGKRFSELEPVYEWQMFNAFRSHTRVPGGEMMVEVQSRVVVEMHRLEEKHRGSSIAVISHADVIRSAISYYAGIPMDLLLRLAIDPASVSIISFDHRQAEIVCVNAPAPPLRFAAEAMSRTTEQNSWPRVTADATEEKHLG